MAAQGKNTGLQVGLIIAVVVALIAMVAAFIIYRNDSQQQTRYNTIEREKNNVQTANEAVRSELEAVKQLVGETAAEVGLGETRQGTVLGNLTAKIETLNTGVGETNLLQVTENLATQLRAEELKAKEQALVIQALNAEKNALEARYDEKARQFAEQAKTATDDRADVQSAAEEQAEGLRAAKQEVEDQLAAVKAELEEEKERLGNRIAALEDERDQLLTVNERLTRELQGLEKGIFTTPDARIVRLERSTGNVYLDIGEDQNLRPGVTFTVYDKDKVGPSGGDNSAKKGSVEVTSVGRYTSEARILEISGDEPFSKGDPVFSPAWSAGRTSKFAFVGMIDLDGDGQTAGERDRLRRVLADAGAEFSVYIDDDGNWVDGDGDPQTNRPIDAETRMLVLAPIPDPTSVADPARQKAYNQMREYKTQLLDQARLNGVPFKSLNEFLESIGYVPQRRRYLPGEDADFNLRRRGGRQPDPNPGNQTSRLYDPDRDRGSKNDAMPSNRFRTDN